MKGMATITRHIGTAIRELTAVLAELDGASDASAGIPAAPSEQTIRNLMCAGEFEEGVHYYRRRRRVMFRWSAVERWMQERSPKPEPFVPIHHARTRKAR